MHSRNTKLELFSLMTLTWMTMELLRTKSFVHIFVGAFWLARKCTCADNEAFRTIARQTHRKSTKLSTVKSRQWNDEVTIRLYVAFIRAFLIFPSWAFCSLSTFQHKFGKNASPTLLRKFPYALVILFFFSLSSVVSLSRFYYANLSTGWRQFQWNCSPYHA